MSIQQSGNGNGGGSGGFQNTVDWGIVANTQVQFAVDLLARYSAGSVDPYTVQVGEIICKQFEISENGRANVSGALSALPCHGTLGNLLWLGFGKRHVVRSMPGTHEGFTCLALCGMLSEYFYEDLASELFHELVRSVAAPPHLTPSVLQWRTLIHACAGVFAKTDFGTLVEEFLDLNPFSWYLEDYEFCGTRASRDKCASPASIATALQGIGDISRGSLAAITIVGGADAGWLAAVAEWLFGLRITIQAADGDVLYKNYRDMEAQIIFIFEHPESAGNRAEYRRQQLQKDATRILHLRPNGQSIASRSGRVEWNSVLTSVFGGAFEFLRSNEAQTLGVTIGSAARLLRAVVSAEAGVPRTLIASWRTYVPTSYGRGFVQNVLERLPELAFLRQGMEDAAMVSFKEAKTSYESQLAKLSITCTSRGCTICGQQGNRVDNTERFCQVVVVETIIALGLTLAEIDVEPGLFPKRIGVEALCKRQVQKRRFPPGDFEFDSTGAPTDMRGSLRKELGPFALVYRDMPTGSDLNLLEASAELFTGFRVLDHQVRGSCPAVSSAGICVYLGVLQGLTDDVEHIGKVHVIPGNIEHNGNPFDRVVDDRRPDQDVAPAEASVFPLLKHYSKIVVKITETATDLEIRFELAGTEIDTPTVNVKPWRLTDAVGQAKGWIQCTGDDTCTFVQDVSAEPNAIIRVLEKDFCLIQGNVVARCAAMALARHPSSKWKCLARGDACLQCCLKAGLRGETAKYYHGQWNANSGEFRWMIV
ncbi:MAG: hypothetical protein Q9160_006985 [Pyrenula sp. 1 TL-2023]